MHTSTYSSPTLRRAIGAVVFSLLSCSSESGTPLDPTDAALIHAEDLEFLGSFRVPGGALGASSFHYGGTAPAFNPVNNSLFLVGHDWDQQVAEIGIPSIVNSPNTNALETAPVLQPFVDVTEGGMYTVDEGTIKIGGLLVWNERLLGTAYSYYDADGNQVYSHFSSSLDLSMAGDVEGMFAVGDHGAGFVSGYMTPVPEEWRDALGAPALTGQCCLSIIGRTSSGPAIFAFDPDQLGNSDPTPGIPLTFYPLSDPLEEWGSTNAVFNGSTEIRGLVFPDGKRSVLFFGRHGIGSFCYGTGDECNDPVDGSKGVHAYPYVYQVWAYDVQDLVAVRNGVMQPWEARPYDMWNLELPIAAAGARVGGVAYEAASDRIYLSAQCAEGDCLPIMHVFAVK